jgi:hypothetical protein
MHGKRKEIANGKRLILLVRSGRCSMTIIALQ